MIRDRDSIWGKVLRDCVHPLGIHQGVTAFRSPWQSPYVERLIGSLRRECLDPVIGLSEGHLRRVLRSYLDDYPRSRTHLSLGKDALEPRQVEGPKLGNGTALPQVGGLHHRHTRRTA
jgi:putative transposase